MVVGFIATYAISAYHHERREFKPAPAIGKLENYLYESDTILYIKKTSFIIIHKMNIPSHKSTSK
jgi:hypothetical protein